MKSLGERLKRAREIKKYTQIEVANMVGISNGTLSGYERNYRDPDTETLIKLANLYNVTLDYLLGQSSRKEQVREEVVPYSLIGEDEKNIKLKLHQAIENLSEENQNFILDIINKIKN